MSTTGLFTAARTFIPADLLPRSGKVFYSGRKAFCAPASLYVLGVNPGGDPDALSDETVASHADWVTSAASEDWSAYRDERWRKKAAGRHGMQPRILHMFKVLGLNPGAVPASNLVFVRSRREGDIASDMERLAKVCWPFHQHVLDDLRPKVVLCLGKTAGDYVRAQTGALERYDTFIERNNRKWGSHAYRSPTGLRVVVATHPSVADWVAEASDPTGLLARALHAT